MKKFFGWVAVFYFIIIHTVSANVIITGTRVIYPGNSKEISIQLNNPGTQPALVQAWIDQPNETNTTPVPFVLTPPISRMEPGTGQTLRLLYTGEALPGDRESLFYFNVLDIPPAPDAQDPNAPKNFLQFAIRSHLKLFFRPAGLKPDVANAPAKVTWSIRSDKRKQLVIANPTPYFITFSKIVLQDGKRDYPLSETPMIDPYGQALVTLPALPHLSANTKINYATINDFGGVSTGNASLSTTPTSP